VAPVNPPQQPYHPPGATGNQITESNHQHLEQKQVFQKYHQVDQALQNQIIAAVPDVHIRALKHATTCFVNVTSQSPTYNSPMDQLRHHNTKRVR
jgi:sensor domain CHASE-containing protein